jgi:hypothetical protein
MAKKIFLMLMVVMVATAYFTIDSNAAGGWYTCTVVMAGPGGGNIYIQLTDKSGSFTSKWFTAPAAKSKEMLAVALTAMSNGLSVRVYTDTSLSGYPQISSFYLMP